MPHEIPRPPEMQGKAHQLVLPLVASVPPVPATLPGVAATIAPPSLWPRLSATARAQVRQQILRVAREVVRDEQRSGQNHRASS